MRRDWPHNPRGRATVSVLHYGPCWCRGKPGDTATFDLYRHRTVEMDLGPLDVNVVLVSDRILIGAEAMARRVYDSVPDPKIVIATAPCPSATRFWQEAALAWVPVRELLAVDMEIETCVSGRPESLLGAVLPLVATRPEALRPTGTELHRAHA